MLETAAIDNRVVTVLFFQRQVHVDDVSGSLVIGIIKGVDRFRSELSLEEVFAVSSKIDLLVEIKQLSDFFGGDMQSLPSDCGDPAEWLPRGGEPQQVQRMDVNSHRRWALNRVLKRGLVAPSRASTPKGDAGSRLGNVGVEAERIPELPPGAAFQHLQSFNRL